MSNRFAVIVVVAALASATTISVTGQQEPLPRVTPRGVAATAAPATEVPPPPQSTSWSGELLVTLPSDPITARQPVTLADAARENDYATFHALYVEARERGENVAPYATLHEIWTYAVTDPLGGFFGADMLNRIARAYPAFPAYIEAYKIVDSRGNVFYPTAETRSFLFAEALRGSTPSATVTATRSTAPRARTTSGTSTTTRGAAARRPQPAATRRTQPAPTRSSAPKATAPAVSAPAVAVVPSATTVASQQATPAAETTTPATANELTTPAATAPGTAVPMTTPASEVSPVPTPAESTPTTTPIAAPAQPSSTGRGLLLLVIGLVGIGILALMLRTPREEMPHSIIDHTAPPAPKAGEKPPATVEPIRKRPAKPAEQQRTRNHA